MLSACCPDQITGPDALEVGGNKENAATQSKSGGRGGGEVEVTPAGNRRGSSASSMLLGSQARTKTKQLTRNIPVRYASPNARTDLLSQRRRIASHAKSRSRPDPWSRENNPTARVSWTPVRDVECQFLQTRCSRRLLCTANKLLRTALLPHGSECCRLRGLPLLSRHDVREEQSGKEAADRAGRRSDKRLKTLRTKVVLCRLLAAYC